MMGFLGRNLKTAIKLPFAMTWDCISLGNLGEGTSTGKVIREHEAEKQLDDVLDVVKKLKDSGVI